ncbi:MAG: hypothetical protein NT085_05180 [candidate division SR1 bacterium]|nr:hypothetical protein [candidate division SR1 bacterium]
MKKIYCIGILVTIVLVMVSCNNSNNGTIDEAKSNINAVKNSVKVRERKAFPDEAYMKGIDSSMFEFYVVMSDKKKSEAWAGQCCLYCNKDNMSYLILPRHCFPYDSTKSYGLWVTDFKNRRTKLSWTRSTSSTLYDAEVLVVEKIKGLPTLCERGKIAREIIVGDSAVLLTPFNVRNVHRKFGTLNNHNEMEMFTMFGEPGDSGGLILGRNGILGVEVTGTNEGKQTQFVPIQVFEELYGDIVYDEKKPS